MGKNPNNFFFFRFWAQSVYQATIETLTVFDLKIKLQKKKPHKKK